MWGWINTESHGQMEWGGQTTCPSLAEAEPSRIIGVAVNQLSSTSLLPVALWDQKSSTILHFQFSKARRHGHKCRRKAQYKVGVAWRRESKGPWHRNLFRLPSTSRALVYHWGEIFGALHVWIRWMVAKMLTNNRRTMFSRVMGHRRLFDGMMKSYSKVTQIYHRLPFLLAP